MSKYYYLVAGLPNISYDDSKPPQAVDAFREELKEYLTSVDIRLLNILLLAVDNRNLLRLLQNPGHDPEPGGSLEATAITHLLRGLETEKEEEKPFVNRNKSMPAYFETFARAWTEEAEKEKEKEKEREKEREKEKEKEKYNPATDITVSWEDRLSAIYYDYAMSCGHPFVARWFEFNLNIQNILAALVCRKYKLDRGTYIVGSTQTAEKLRTSTARDFDLGDETEYLPTVMRIAEETDMLQRERKIDLLKWEWLDTQTLVRIFDVDNLLAYLIRLQIIERWATLDKATGEQTFRSLVGTMKRGSNNALEEFKRNNKK